MNKPQKTTKKPKKKGVCVRFDAETLDWLSAQVNPKSEDTESIPAVVRTAVREKRRALQKK